MSNGGDSHWSRELRASVTRLELTNRIFSATAWGVKRLVAPGTVVIVGGPRRIFSGTTARPWSPAGFNIGFINTGTELIPTATFDIGTPPVNYTYEYGTMTFDGLTDYFGRMIPAPSGSAPQPQRGRWFNWFMWNRVSNKYPT